MDKHKGHALLGSSLLGVHTTSLMRSVVMPDWDWVVLLSAVLLAVFAVDGVVSTSAEVATSPLFRARRCSASWCFKLHPV